MDTERNNYASKGVAGTGLGLAIGALGVEVLRGGLNGILGGNTAPAPATTAVGNDAIVAALMAAASRGGCNCNEDHVVNRYEAGKDARIAELETEIKLRDANTYTDSKMLEMYQYVDGRLRGVESQLCQQAVVNTQVAANLSCLQKTVDVLSGMTKTVIPINNICPEPMARYNSWTAPTTETPAT